MTQRYGIPGNWYGRGHLKSPGEPGNQLIRGVLRDEVDAEPALAQVLDGGAKMIHLVIDDEETVVGAVEGMELHMFGGVLGIVAAEGQLHIRGLMDIAHVAIDGGREIGAHPHSLENVGIDVVIYEDDSALGSLEKGLDEDVGIEHLAVEEDAEFLFERAVFEPTEDLVYLLIGRELLEFHGIKSLKNGSIGNDELAHGMEGIIDADGHLDCYAGTEDRG